jgi:hypothetical protein
MTARPPLNRCALTGAPQSHGRVLDDHAVQSHVAVSWHSEVNGLRGSPTHQRARQVDLSMAPGSRAPLSTQ